MTEWSLAPFGAIDVRRPDMGKGGRKRKGRKKNAANHGKRPNS